MRILQCNLRPLAVAVAMTAAVGLLATSTALAVAPAPAGTTPDRPPPEYAGPVVDNPQGIRYSPADAQGRMRHIVVLTEEPLASYGGGSAGFARIPRQSAALSAGRIDVRSREALAYVDHLRVAQEKFAADVSSALKRNVPVVAQFQHALNAVAFDLTGEEAAQLRRRSDVKLVTRERVYALQTYATPALIGATSVWNGAATPGGVATKGEGVVIGVIDTGINWASDSFKATGADGYTHVNPLGTGKYLGNCAPGGVDAGKCNDKLIGIYNFAANFTSGEDLQGHGSHTASTAAGNAVSGAPYLGGTFKISGIAPHANIIAYSACVGIGCPEVGTVGSINQAVADGIVDVINYSIGGPTPSPWEDTSDLAFLGATNAGIFVSKAAGNDGPGAQSVGGSSAPWETVVAATTPARNQGFAFSLTAPTGAPNTIGILAVPGEAVPTQAHVDVPLIESPTFDDAAYDGCTAYPDNYFRRGQTADGAQGIAVVAYDFALDFTNPRCSATSRIRSAATAGALATLLVSTKRLSRGDIPGTAVAYSVRSADWSNIKATPGIDVTPTGNAKATLGFPATDIAIAADDIAGFSSRGPSPFMMLRPDLAAPGVNIFAAVAPANAAGYSPANLADTARRYDIISGTSMAAPHVAGAAALVRAVNRSWTPMEIRSALMTTAAPVRDEDSTTPAHPNTAGAGRIDLAKATRAGLLFDETYANFAAADPDKGGKVETLNVASFYHFDCVGTCTFTRKVRSSGASGTWTIAVLGLPAGSYTLDKTSFALGGTDSASFTLSVDSTRLPAGQWNYGQMTLTSSDANVPAAHLPIALRSATAKLRTDVGAFAVSVPTGGRVTRLVNVSNPGNAGLDWRLPDTRLSATVFERKATTNVRGLVSTVGAFARQASVSADWFDIDVPGSRLTRLEVTGFSLPIYPLPENALFTAWAVYADDNGRPAGIPLVADSPMPVVSYRSQVGGDENLHLRVDRRFGLKHFALDAVAAGMSKQDLPAGRYWLNTTVVDVAFPWVQSFAEVPGKAPPAQHANFSIDKPAEAAWGPSTAEDLGGPDATGLAMKIDIDAPCGAPWIRYDTTAGNLGSGGSSLVRVTFDAGALAPGTYKAYVCVSGNGTSPSNDYTDDVDARLIPVTFTVTTGDKIFASDFE